MPSLLQLMRRWTGRRDEATASAPAVPAVLRLGSAAAVPMPLPGEPWRGAAAVQTATAFEEGLAPGSGALPNASAQAGPLNSLAIGDDPHAVRRSLALARLDALPDRDTPVYQFVADAAAMVCQAPLAAITLLDDATQWLHARVGIALEFTPVEMSFCRYALGLHPGTVFEVRDTLIDTRFSQHPMVRGEPHVRFYAGAPIALSDGLTLGTVCVLDTCVRALTPAQVEALRQLAIHVARLLESRAPQADSMLPPLTHRG